jgi:DNA mismatch repair ATPase MutS
MILDKQSKKDLHIFPEEGQKSLFEHIDFTITSQGKLYLKQLLLKTPATWEDCIAQQETIRFMVQHTACWPSTISNGTLLLLEQFYETADTFTGVPSSYSFFLQTLLKKIFQQSAYAFIQSTYQQFADFYSGLAALYTYFNKMEVPVAIANQLAMLNGILEQELVRQIVSAKQAASFHEKELFVYKARRVLKLSTQKAIEQLAQLDAFLAMAKATDHYKWSFPVITPTAENIFDATQLTHPLLAKAVPFSLSLSKAQPLLILTGANMSGKTTCIRAVGIATILAHLGMGVPAEQLRISFRNGVVTNMQISDDLFKGESYFMSEVNRIKQTVSTVVAHKGMLLLMDELFKGTNVHDANECTKAILEGLLHQEQQLMILSTHLYEAAEHFQHNEKVQFAYFEIQEQSDDTYSFTYALKKGISSDRIGYKILKKENVLSILNNNV